MRVERRETVTQPARNVDDLRGRMPLVEDTADVEGAVEDRMFMDPRWVQLVNRFILATLKQRARQKPRYLSEFLQCAQDLYPEGEPWK